MARRRKGELPRYRLHKQSGQTVVSLPLGGGKYRDFLLGPFDSEESKREYIRVIKKFLLVKEGQKVRKGDVIAYLYTPPSSGDGCHIHFHLMIDGRKGFLAPATFTPEVVKSFHKQ
jgi:hypothetical protein